MKSNKKPYEPDPLDLRNRRRQRQRRERRIKWFLAALTVAVIILIAIIFRQIALRHFGGEFKAPLENPTYWYQQTQDVLFLTITPTISPTPTATVPSPTLTPTETFTPTLSPTPTLTPTPKLRPRKTVEGNAAELLAQAESTMTAKHFSQGNTQYSEYWFETIGSPSTFDASSVYPNADCTWMGVAGVLVDKRNQPQIGFFVQVGFADGSLVETLSGLFPGYGDSGYEITLARPVQAFDKPVWIQIFDEYRLPASEKIYFRPSSDCSKSLTMINFQRIK
jgi:hypothetical protein